ncbi:MAG: 3-deoxy-D-manno-octulosonic acid transferase, partial [Deltaproteobacteria bacterium]|nr:3-deoxy-D-manno-octulosonic acid transferase [Deltaproteobacteria bacterium]
RPSLLILVETDIWPGLLSCMRKRGVQVILVNGRVSPRTFRSYRRFRSLSRRVLGMMELCLMQSDLDRKRLLEIGLPPEMVETVGNINLWM